MARGKPLPVVNDKLVQTKGSTAGRFVQYSVNEIFGPTIQGEGPLAGAVTHFIRLNGCDYRCNWCDSMEAVLPELIRRPENHEIMTSDHIIDRILSMPRAGMVTISGGNPGLWAEVRDLVSGLQNAGFKVAVETQGSKVQSWFNEVDHLILSPKPPSSGMAFKPDTLHRAIQAAIAGQSPLAYKSRVALKVVVFDDPDLEFAYDVHCQFPDFNFYLQVGTPQESPKPHLEEMNEYYRLLVEKVLKQQRFANVRILPQLHKYLFGHGRGV